MGNFVPAGESRQLVRQPVRPALLVVGVISRILPQAKPYVQKLLIRAGYELLSLRGHRTGTLFMNYGYSVLDPSLPSPSLEREDERDRLPIQLYHRVASAVDLRGADVLEVGCGRGGGSSYVKRYLGPRTVTGLDFAARAIRLCRRYHQLEGLRFRRGDAEALPFPENAFDIVLNVESSHCYPDVSLFFSEVYRVLRPSGHFLFADLRPKEQIDQLRDALIASGLTLLEEERITPNVVKSLEIDSEHRRAMVERNAPWWLRKSLNDFAAVKDTPVYNMLSIGQLEYLRFVLQKPGSA